MRILTILIMTLFLFSCDKKQVSSTVDEKIPEKKSYKTTVEKTEEQEDEPVGVFTSTENNDPEEESDYVKINRLYKLAKKKGPCDYSITPQKTNEDGKKIDNTDFVNSPAAFAKTAGYAQVISDNIKNHDYTHISVFFSKGAFAEGRKLKASYVENLPAGVPGFEYSVKGRVNFLNVSVHHEFTHKKGMEEAKSGTDDDKDWLPKAWENDGKFNLKDEPGNINSSRLPKEFSGGIKGNKKRDMEYYAWMGAGFSGQFKENDPLGLFVGRLTNIPNGLVEADYKGSLPTPASEATLEKDWASGWKLNTGGYRWRTINDFSN